MPLGTELMLTSNRVFQPAGFMYMSVPYSCMEEVYVVARWDVGYKFCIRIVVSDGSLLLQVRTTYFYIIVLWCIESSIADVSLGTVR